jgi:asparagine synthase (glutamine-hydrolysing)
MCGIAGILKPPHAIVDPACLALMGRTQTHRGPDNFAVFSEANFGCAHNRLSILDLSPAGNQPYADARYVLVYNGEIYNYLELRQKLEGLGERFTSSSDTAVLFAHLARFGVPATLRAIRGMFAFSFYDRQEQTVTLCRDRLGIKPLVWSYRGGALYWASEVKALRAVCDAQPDPIKTLYAMVGSGEHASAYTIFSDVNLVPPGTSITCRAGEAPRPPETYYDIFADVDPMAYNALRRMPQPALDELFGELLARSVKGMLMSDAPMGAFVSGGIDSGLIGALAAAQDPDLALFTANVVGRHSEFADAQLLSAHVQRPLFEARFTPEMLIDDWAQTTWHYEVPLITHTNAAPFARVAQAARAQGVKAVLTGEGADELFLGYPKLLARRFQKYLAAPVNLMKAGYGLLPELRAYLFPETTPSTEGFLNLAVQGFERQRLRAAGYEAYAFVPPAQRAEQYLTIQMLREGLIGLLHRNDRMGMLASIESRFPFLDEELVRFAINLPVQRKIGRTWRLYNPKHPFLVDKAIVRRAAASHLPPALQRKRKSGFPMYGLRNVRTRAGYFQGGYVAGLLRLSPEAEAYMLRAQPPYQVAKLIAIDVFGRLFGMGQSVAQVSEHLKAWVTIASDAPQEQRER